jgi:hypothetical protein
MSWNVEYLPEKGVVVVIAKGEVSGEDALAQLAEIIGVLKENQASIVLADYSDALSEVPLASIYWMPDQAAKLGAPWRLHVAVVLPRTGYRIDTYQFLATVGKNAGYDVRLFETRAAAECWLQQSPAVRPQTVQHADALASIGAPGGA